MEFRFKRIKLNLTVLLPFELRHVDSSLLGPTCLTTRQSFVTFSVVIGAKYWGSLWLAVRLITDLVTQVNIAGSLYMKTSWLVHTMMKCRGRTAVNSTQSKLRYYMEVMVSFAPRPLFRWQTDGILGLYLMNLYVDTAVSQDPAATFFMVDV